MNRGSGHVRLSVVELVVMTVATIVMTLLTADIGFTIAREMEPYVCEMICK